MCSTYWVDWGFHKSAWQRKPKENKMGAYEEEEQSAFQKYRVVLGCGLVAVIAVAVWFGQKHSARASRPRQEQNVILVNLPPPPPVPPAPRPPSQSPPPTESQQKMIEQAPVNETETK